jgi:hypothetical protein
MPAAADCPGYWMKPFEASWLDSPGRYGAPAKRWFRNKFGRDQAD